MIEAQSRLWQTPATDDNRNWAALMASPEAGDSAPVDVELPTGRWIRVKRAATTEGGTVMLLTDVTDIKRQEATLALQARQLAASNQELEQFAAVASHDLQEPLRKIEAFGARLGQKMDGKLDEESGFFLERMMSATGRMRVLITDLLSYSRVGRKEGRHREIDLDRLLADVLDDLALTVAERKAVVRAGRLGTMLGEPTQMRQLFQNLLSNAFKFARKDVPPLVEIERKPAADGGLVLTFRDHGIGFDMKHHDKIFEIFHRLHGREQYEGTGIGLATCRKIVERHGGHLRAESTPGEGAAFIAVFPRASAELSAAASSMQQPSAA